MNLVTEASCNRILVFRSVSRNVTNQIKVKIDHQPNPSNGRQNKVVQSIRFLSGEEKTREEVSKITFHSNYKGHRSPVR